MTRDELRQLVAMHLDRPGDISPWSEQPGAVLYSGLSSLRPGPFYLLGINPGGEGGKAIRDNLCAHDGTNNFADEDWGAGTDERTRFQKRVCDLMDALGIAPADIPSTNLVFARSPKLADLADAGAWLQRCWPVHQAFLRNVRPAWIVMLGFGRAYYFLCDQGRTLQAEQPIKASSIKVAWHRRLNLDLGEGQRLDVRVLAVAHPGSLGFNRAGLGASEGYPDAVKEFIARNVRAD